jgi:putative ABC transport system ATP-binding protein
MQGTTCLSTFHWYVDLNAPQCSATVLCDFTRQQFPLGLGPIASGRDVLPSDIVDEYNLGQSRPPTRSGPKSTARSPAMAALTIERPHTTRRCTAARAVDAVKVYGQDETEVRALDGVSVDFQVGGFTAIMGPSGSGKSTLLHCMAGLDDLTSGQAFIGDADLSTLKDKDLTFLRRDHVGFVFQAYNLVPTLTAEENIKLPLLLAGKKGDSAWIAYVEQTMGIVDRLHHHPNELSGGQQQRVAVARALASRPEIIFADEPTGNLDSRAGAEVLGLMRRAVDEMGQTIVMVSHDPVAASYADRIVFLADGKVVDEMEHPTPERVLERMKRFGE